MLPSKSITVFEFNRYFLKQFLEIRNYTLPLISLARLQIKEFCQSVLDRCAIECNVVPVFGWARFETRTFWEMPKNKVKKVK